MNLAAGGILLEPPDTTPGYANSFFLVKVTVSPQGNAPWTASPTATIVTSSPAKVQSQATLPLETGTDQTGNRRGIAQFIVAIARSSGGQKFTVGLTTTELPGLKQSQTYAILNAADTALEEEPVSVLFKIVDTDELTPSNAPELAVYSILATSNNVAIPNYVVMWFNYLVDGGLLRVNAYDSRDAKTPLQPISLNNSSDSNTLILTTGPDGRATLYITPTTEQTSLMLVCSPHASEQTQFNQIIFYNDSPISSPYSAPHIDATIHDNYYDLSPDDSQDVNTTIALLSPPNDASVYVVSVINENQYAKNLFHNTRQNPTNTSFFTNIPKDLVAFSTPGDDQNNNTYFVIVTPGGNVSRSLDKNFKAIDGSDPYTPPNVHRTLPAPAVIPDPHIINIQAIANGLIVTIKPGPAYVLKSDDLVVANFYIAAWNPVTGHPKPASSNDTQKATAADADRNTITASFKVDQLVGFDSSRTVPPQFGAITFDYYVVPANTGDVPENREWSQTITYMMDTAPPGNWVGS